MQLTAAHIRLVSAMHMSAVPKHEFGKNITSQPKCFSWEKFLGVSAATSEQTLYGGGKIDVLCCE